ncbi:MAG: hypothetical protein WC622_03680 [Pedobacter sp.]
MIQIKFTREDLYNIVWEKPLSHFIELYGGTYAEVKMLLEKYKIPVPPNGYWSQLRAGHIIEKKALHIDNTIAEKIIYEPKPPKIKREKRIEQHFQKAEEKSVDKFDKVVSEAQRIYQAEAKGRDNKKLISIGYHALSINVSPTLIEKSLRFFNSVIIEIKKAGGTISVMPHSTFTMFNGEKFVLLLREKQNRIEKKDAQYSWDNYEYIGSGILHFKIGENSWNSKEWKDTTYVSIEEKVNDIIEFLKLAAIKAKEHRKEQELWRAKVENERQIKVNIEKRQATELVDFFKLKTDSELWEKAVLMRRYLEETERLAREQNRYNEEMENYLLWARSKVDWYDPFINKDDELLNDVDKKTLTAVKKGYW